MLRRLPISLRFDDEDSDFYFGFIEVKKNNRELSSLILNLLHLYYENEEVRNLMDEYLLSKSPYIKIHEEIQRITLEHNRQTVTTSMLGDYTKNEKRNLEHKEEDTKQSKETPKEDVMMLTQAEFQNEVKKAVDSVMSEWMKQFKNELTTSVENKESLDVGNKENKVVETIKSDIKIPNQEKVQEIKRPKSFGKLLDSVK